MTPHNASLNSFMWTQLAPLCNIHENLTDWWSISLNHSPDTPENLLLLWTHPGCSNVHTSYQYTTKTLGQAPFHHFNKQWKKMIACAAQLLFQIFIFQQLVLGTATTIKYILRCEFIVCSMKEKFMKNKLISWWLCGSLTTKCGEDGTAYDWQATRSSRSPNYR